MIENNEPDVFGRCDNCRRNILVGDQAIAITQHLVRTEVDNEVTAIEEPTSIGIWCKQCAAGAKM